MGACVRHRKGLGARKRPREGGSLGKCLSPPSAQRETASACGEGQGRDLRRGSRCVISRRFRLRRTPAVLSKLLKTPLSRWGRSLLTEVTSHP